MVLIESEAGKSPNPNAPLSIRNRLCVGEGFLWGLWPLSRDLETMPEGRRRLYWVAGRTILPSRQHQESQV